MREGGGMRKKERVREFELGVVSKLQVYVELPCLQLVDVVQVA